ncbi:hypothetical protein [Laspinema olomoucense]|nr:hypothetical protein [Laspinema sp. D3b]
MLPIRYRCSKYPNVLGEAIASNGIQSKLIASEPLRMAVQRDD